MNINKLDSLIAKSDKPEKMKRIVNQLRACGFTDSYMTGREIKALPNIIGDDETIKFGASGIYDDANSASVLIVVTDKRVIFENKKLFFGSQNTEIPLEMINDVSYNSGLIMTKLFITSGAKTHKVSAVPKTLIAGLVKTIRLEAERVRNNKQKQSMKDSNSGNDDIAKLRELKQLVDENVITQEEFEAKKKQILGL